MNGKAGRFTKLSIYKQGKCTNNKYSLVCVWRCLHDGMKGSGACAAVRLRKNGQIEVQNHFDLSLSGRRKFKNQRGKDALGAKECDWKDLKGEKGDR